jgi:hypothetical protein
MHHDIHASQHQRAVIGRGVEKNHGTPLSLCLEVLPGDLCLVVSAWWFSLEVLT